MCFDYENGDKTEKIRNGGYMNINRDYYLNQLIEKQNNGLVKIISRMRSSINFLKIDNGNIIYLNLDEKPKDKKEAKYYKLLTEQLFWLNRNDVKVFKRSKNLSYKYKNKDLNENIIKRCCNFPLPIKKCKKYNNIEQKV